MQISVYSIEIHTLFGGQRAGPVSLNFYQPKADRYLEIYGGLAAHTD